MEYREFTKRGQQQEESSVWLYFLNAASDKTAKCKKCNEILETEGSISSLRSHLQTTHAMTLGDETAEHDHEEEELLPVPLKKGRLNDFEDDESMEELVSRMVCLDGLAFRVLANSVDLRHLFLESGYELPSSAKAIRSIVWERSEFAKQQILQELNTLKLRGVLFSITLNELTSQAKQKYIKVNIHSTSINNLKCCHNIGLIKIRGTTTSTRCAELLNLQLELFGLTMKDIVGLTTDSASMMQKMGQTIQACHQLCYAQGLQLAILDVLYQRQPIVCSECEEYSSGSESSDSSGGEEYDSDNDKDVTVETSRRQVPITNSDCNSVINKVRNVCKLLRESPTENHEALQKYVKQNFEKDMNLILDCKTLWSSLVSMLEQFIKLYSCIQRALYDLKSEISFSAEEIELIKHIHASLAIFKVSLEMLYENDATLLTADFVLKFTLRKLEKTTGPLNAAFIAALRKRIGERYLLIQGVLKYLDDPEGFYNETDVDSVFVRPSQEDIVSTIVSLLGKSTKKSGLPDTTTFDLAPEVSQKDENISSMPSISRSSPLETSGKVLFKEEIPPVEVLQQHLCPNIIQAEMALYESGRTRGQYLEMAYRQLLLIKPTSVESERTFSTTAHVCAKFPSRMNYTTINALVILKHCFSSLNE